MTKIADYTVVSEHDLEKMTQMVKALINEHGWQPYGSFQVSVPVIDEGAAPLYCQAMVKYADA
jgi:hypothetical protein